MAAKKAPARRSYDDETPRKLFHFLRKQNIVICFELVADGIDNYHLFENAVNYDTSNFHKVYLGYHDGVQTGLTAMNQSIRTYRYQGWQDVGDGEQLTGFTDLFNYTAEYLASRGTMVDSNWGRDWRPVVLPDSFEDRELDNPFNQQEGFRKLDI